MMQVAGDLEIGWVISNLEIKLVSAKEKFPTKDFSEQETIIEILKKYRESNLNLIQDFRSVKSFHREEIGRTFTLQRVLTDLRHELKGYKDLDENLNKR